MFAQDDLYICVGCGRLLCVGKGWDHVMQYQKDPATNGNASLTWLCGTCYLTQKVEQVRPPMTPKHED